VPAPAAQQGELLVRGAGDGAGPLELLVDSGGDDAPAPGVELQVVGLVPVGLTAAGAPAGPAVALPVGEGAAERGDSDQAVPEGGVLQFVVGGLHWAS